MSQPVPSGVLGRKTVSCCRLDAASALQSPTLSPKQQLNQRKHRTDTLIAMGIALLLRLLYLIHVKATQISRKGQRKEELKERKNGGGNDDGDTGDNGDGDMGDNGDTGGNGDGDADTEDNGDDDTGDNNDGDTGDNDDSDADTEDNGDGDTDDGDTGDNEWDSAARLTAVGLVRGVRTGGRSVTHLVRLHAQRQRLVLARKLVVGTSCTCDK